MDKVIIGRDAYDKIMHYVHKADFEVSGLGVVEVIDNVPVITDIMLLEQEGSAAETELDADSINKALYEHHKSGEDGEIKFWWHSHVNMEVFWSGTDMKTIEQLTQNGWFIHGVFNKKNESKFAATSKEPFELFIDNIELEIDESYTNSVAKAKLIDKIAELDKAMYAECDKQFESKVTKTVYKSMYNAGYDKYKNGTNHHSKQGVGGALEEDMGFPMGGAGYEHYMAGDFSQFDEPIPSALSEYERVEALERAELATWGYDEEEILSMNEYGIFNEEDLAKAEEHFGPIYPGHIHMLKGGYAG